MLAGTFGLVALVCLVGVTLWLVFTIHGEFKGGSGFNKGWPTAALLAILIGFYFFTKSTVTPDLAAEHAASLSFGQTYLSNLTFGRICLTLAEYIGVGIIWSLVEARVTLWRDKKSVVKAWEAHLKTDVTDYVKEWLIKEIGTSKTGNQAGSTWNFKTLIGEGKAAIAREWNHLVTGAKYTVEHAFQDAAAIRTTVAGAQQEFKDDVAKFHIGMKQFVTEAERVQFNPNTAYLKFQTNPDGTLTTSVEKGALAICLANWTFWWWAYALNFFFGDMLEAIFTRFAAWVTKHYGAYVSKYFSDLGLTPKPALAAVAPPPAPAQPPATGTNG